MGLDNVNVKYFQWKGQHESDSEPEWERLRANHVALIIRMLAWEADHGPIAEEKVRQALCYLALGSKKKKKKKKT
jgi:hypothetical protein